MHHFTIPPAVYNSLNFSASLQTCVYLFFFNNSHPTGVRRWLTVVLICIFSMTLDVEHLFIYLLAICLSSWEKCLCKSLDHFLIGLFAFVCIFAIEL